ncbi:MAG: hypothetical protein QG614_402 [Patescibacteria group bacterium]|nr:hypothetical protein [Patescibacteria group bacterium]
MQSLWQQTKIFLFKQSSSAIFGGVLLFFIALSYFYMPSNILRYDLLFLIAIITQIVFLYFKIETIKEVLIILVFHIFAMLMEIYKVSIGSWVYPNQAIFSIASVPLFTGFMYSAIGSYIFRAWKINKFRFINLPSNTSLLLLGLGIYINFFTNHYIYDFRYVILAIAILLFWKTKLYVEITDKIVQINPLVANALSAFVIWLSEQAGTLFRIWSYPNQILSWQPVSFDKYTSWYMLMIFSFIIITILSKDQNSKNNNS